MILNNVFDLENGVPKTAFYRLIQLGVDETGQGQVDAIMKAFQEDEIVDTIRQRLVGVVSDGKFKIPNFSQKMFGTKSWPIYCHNFVV